MDNRFTRRDGLQMLAGLGAVVSASNNGVAQPTSERPPLVAYFSRTGNTRLAARQIRRAVNGDLFEIEPAIDYPEDYRQTVDQAKRESDAAFEPPLKRQVANIAAHDVVYLGFPIWGMTPPPVIRTFLSGHDLAGKRLVPIITHGGYGTGQSLSVLARLAPQARLQAAFVMKADQERDALGQVTRWLGRAPGRG